MPFETAYRRLHDSWRKRYPATFPTAWATRRRRCSLCGTGAEPYISKSRLGKATGSSQSRCIRASPRASEACLWQRYRRYIQVGRRRLLRDFVRPDYFSTGRTGRGCVEAGRIGQIAIMQKRRVQDHDRCRDDRFCGVKGTARRMTPWTS